MALPFLILSAAARQPALASGPSGYRTGGTHRAVSAGLAVSIAGGVGAALFLALVAPQMMERDPGILIGDNIPVRPPVVEDEPAPRLQDSRVVITKPITDLRPLADDPITIDRFETDFGDVRIETGGGGLSGGGLGGGVIERLPEPSAPVWRNAIRDPRFADRFQPAYPGAMEREGTEGRCPVTVTIAASGRVTAVRDNGCATGEFYRATERQALRQWRFRPATRDGVAVESTQDVAVMFRIEE